jgi:hypothetical protein
MRKNLYPSLFHRPSHRTRSTSHKTGTREQTSKMRMGKTRMLLVGKMHLVGKQFIRDRAVATPSPMQPPLSAPHRWSASYALRFFS